MRHYITEVTNPVPPAPDSNSGQNPGPSSGPNPGPNPVPVTYNVINGSDNIHQTLQGTIGRDDFRIDSSASLWFTADYISGFEKGRDLISLDGGGNVWWGRRYDGASGRHDGYYLYSASDSGTSRNAIAEIVFSGSGSDDSFTLEQADFGPGTTLAGRASHDVLEFTHRNAAEETVDLNSFPGGATRAQIVLTSYTATGTASIRQPLVISNFIDGQDKFADHRGGTVYVENGVDTGAARRVTLRVRDEVTNDKTIMAHIENFTGTFNADDLAAGTEYRAVTPVSYTLRDGSADTSQTLRGTSATDEFLFDNTAGNRSSVDVIRNFKADNADRLTLEGGGNVWWAKWLGADGSTKGYYLLGSDDSTAGDNFLAFIEKTKGFDPAQERFHPYTKLVGRATHNLVDLTDAYGAHGFRQLVDLGTGFGDSREGHVVVVDRVITTPLLSAHRPDRVRNFADDEDRIALDNSDHVQGGVTVYVQNGADTGAARTVTVRNSNDTSSQDNILVLIEGFSDTFDADDVVGNVIVQDIM